MLSYKPNNHDPIKFFFRELLFAGISLLAIWLMEVLVFKMFSYSSVFLGIYLVIRIIRIEQISTGVFNDHQKEVTIFYTKCFKKRVESLRFEEVYIEIRRSRLTRFFAEPMSIYFLKGITEYFELNTRKDGFSVATLEDIINEVKSHSIPVAEK